MKIRSMTVAALAAALLVPLALPAAEQPATPKAARAETKCEPTAQSRIRKSKATGCKDAVQTRSYSRDDLLSTGQFDSAEALRRLDPRFQ